MIEYNNDYDELRAVPHRFQVIYNGTVVHSESYSGINAAIDFQKFTNRMNVLRNAIIDSYLEDR